MNTQYITRKDEIILFDTQLNDPFFSILNIYKNPNLIRTIIFGSSDHHIFIEFISFY